jgi:hypothetical protein
MIGSHREAPLIRLISTTDVSGSDRPRRDCPILLRRSCGTGEVEPVRGTELFKLKERAGAFAFGLVSVSRGISEDGPDKLWLERLVERGDKRAVVQRQPTHCPTVSLGTEVSPQLAARRAVGKGRTGS